MGDRRDYNMDRKGIDKLADFIRSKGELAETPALHLLDMIVGLQERIAVMEKRTEEAQEVLRQIGDYAHGRSTGPTVPDALWEVREMAYRGFCGF